MDAIEVVNTSHKNPVFNQRAKEYSKQYKKPVTGGSDSHHMKDYRGGMIFQDELKDVFDFINHVKNRDVLKIIE